MEPIILYKPVVLCGDLMDMTADERVVAAKLLKNEAVLVPDGDDFRIVETNFPEEEFPDNCLFGSEAVCCYRKALGYRDVSINKIELDDIMGDVDMFQLADITTAAFEALKHSDRLKDATGSEKPKRFLAEMYSLLRNAVESLQDIHWNENPFFEDGSGFGPVNSEEFLLEEQHSLAEIGYKLSEHQIRTHNSEKEN